MKSRKKVKLEKVHKVPCDNRSSKRIERMTSTRNSPSVIRDMKGVRASRCEAYRIQEERAKKKTEIESGGLRIPV